MYNYLATLRLQQTKYGYALLVGPKRRVVFGGNIFLPKGREKIATKAALRPLSGLWSKPEGSECAQTGVPVMSYREFRNQAKRLLREAGYLNTPESGD